MKGIGGQGVWKFKHRPDLSKFPVGDDKLKVAHGSFTVDKTVKASEQSITFGLRGVGILRMAPDLSGIDVIGGEGFDKNQNLHNNCLLERNGEKLLVFCSDSAREVWITDFAGKLVQKLTAPKDSKFVPTDAVVVGKKLYVTSGYGDGVIYAADVATGEWTGEKFGSKPFFSTSHGLMVTPKGDGIMVADRENGRLRTFTTEGKEVADIMLPGKPHPCDIDVSEDGRHLLAGCLRGPGGGNAVFYILEGDSVVSTVCPADLGVQNSRHIHNAAFRFVTTADGKSKCYVLCYFWNPGGFAVFERVEEA